MTDGKVVNLKCWHGPELVKYVEERLLSERANGREPDVASWAALEARKSQIGRSPDYDALMPVKEAAHEIETRMRVAAFAGSDEGDGRRWAASRLAALLVSEGGDEDIAYSLAAEEAED